jgi:hypothetical protein
MSRLLVPFMALVLAAIVPAPSPAQAAPIQDQEQVARATSTESTARQHPRHRRSAHSTGHRRTHTAHRQARSNHRVAHSGTQHHRTAQRRAPRTTSPT